MKKQLGILALVAVMFASCTNDDSQNTDTTAGIEKTSINFSVAQDAKQTTNKVIDRGTIPLYVDNLTIKATSNVLTSWFASETFTFTNAGVTAFAPQLTLDNVVLGLNTFSATSTSANTNKVFALTNANSSSLTTLLGKTPYIPCYSATNPTATIIAGTNSPVNLTMKTDHGRIVTLFKIDAPDADKYKAVVTATVGANTLTGTIDPTTVNRFLTFEWSNEDAVKDAVVTFNIKVYAVSAPNNVLNEITKTLKIIDSKSISCVYTLTNNDVHENITTGGITITFPTIEEVNCEDVYDSTEPNDPVNPENPHYNCKGRNSHGYNRQGFNKCGWHKAPNAFYNANQDENTANGSANECGN